MGSETTVSVINAIASMLRSEFGQTEVDFSCAIACSTDGIYLAEYHRSSVVTDLAIYNPATGEMRAGRYDSLMRTIAQYHIGSHKTSCDGVVCILALFPTLLKDDEFRDCMRIDGDIAVKWCEKREFFAACRLRVPAGKLITGL